MSESAELAEYLSDLDFIEYFGSVSAERHPDLITLAQQVYGGLVIARLVGRHGVWESVEDAIDDLLRAALYIRGYQDTDDASPYAQTVKGKLVAAADRLRAVSEKEEKA